MQPGYARVLSFGGQALAFLDVYVEQRPGALLVREAILWPVEASPGLSCLMPIAVRYREVSQS
jgi:hypothetical protein